jgi:hypothetical protein
MSLGQSFVVAGGLFGSPWTNPNISPWPMAVLLLPGIFLMALRGKEGVFWLLATVVAFPLSISRAAAHDQFADARYHLPVVYLGCVVVGMGIAGGLRACGRVLRNRQIAAPLTAAIVALIASGPRLDILNGKFAFQEEYRFYRAEAKRIPSQCTVVAPLGTNDGGFVPSARLGGFRLFDAIDYPQARAPGECTYFYRGGNCYAPESYNLPQGEAEREIPPCAALETNFHLEAVARASILASPFRAERYTVDPLPLGFFRLEGERRE